MLKRMVFALIWIAAFAVIVFVGVLLVDQLIEGVLLPEDYLFYEHSPLGSTLLAPLIAVPGFLLVYYSLYKLRFKLPLEDDDELILMATIGKKMGKWKIVLAVLWAIALYGCLTSMTYVTPDRIVVTTPWDPVGKAYAYAEVEGIETGFGSKTFSFLDYEEKGSFYYKVVLGGRETVFHVPSVNPDVERYEEDTYLELEEFDRALRERGVSKTSSAEGYEKCGYDQPYVDRFLRIIELK